MLRGFVGSFFSLAGVACGLTWLYLGMREVMEIGGACGEGGAVVYHTPCPDGVPLLMVGGIFGGLICLALFAWFAGRLGGSYSTLAAFAWPALFLSLGWNFLEFGIDPPGEESGLVWGWLICAVVFFLMGGLPLLALARPSVLRKMLWPPDPDPLAPRPPVPIGIPLGASLSLGDRRARRRERESELTTRPGAPGYHGGAPIVAPPALSGDVVAQLERLAALRDRGALDADEYERAKKAVLDE